MFGFVLAVHVLICFLMIVVILLQSGKGGGLAGAFGGGASATVFGGRGATTVLTRATMILGILFFLTSLTLALTGGSDDYSKTLPGTVLVANADGSAAREIYRGEAEASRPSRALA